MTRSVDGRSIRARARPRWWCPRTSGDTSLCDQLLHLEPLAYGRRVAHYSPTYGSMSRLCAPSARQEPVRLRQTPGGPTGWAKSVALGGDCCQHSGRTRCPQATRPCVSNSRVNGCSGCRSWNEAVGRQRDGAGGGEWANGPDEAVAAPLKARVEPCREALSAGRVPTGPLGHGLLRGGRWETVGTRSDGCANQGDGPGTTVPDKGATAAAASSCAPTPGPTR